ncbi:MAG: ABC transporter ATPase [Chitinophagales bacterium]|nr:ABC transporter ATPase [Chitinophagales bacterium]
MDPSSKTWIYMSSRPFTDLETTEIEIAVNHFAKAWTAHGSNLKASGEVRFNRFIILMVDESHAGASGCSIDKSVHFIKSLEQQFDVEFFNRLLFAWKERDEIHVSTLSAFPALYNNHEITDETIVFDNNVTTKKQFDERWLVILRDSWMFPRLRKASIKI